MGQLKVVAGGLQVIGKLLNNFFCKIFCLVTNFVRASSQTNPIVRYVENSMTKKNIFVEFQVKH